MDNAITGDDDSWIIHESVRDAARPVIHFRCHSHRNNSLNGHGDSRELIAVVKLSVSYNILIAAINL